MGGWKTENRKELRRPRLAARLTSLLLAGAMLLPGGALAPRSAAAAERGDLSALDSNTYALQVTTGTVSGSLADEILYFKIVYEDQDGYVRSHRIYPGENALKDSTAWAQETGAEQAAAAPAGGQTSAAGQEQPADGSQAASSQDPAGQTAAACAATLAAGTRTALAKKLGVTVRENAAPFRPYSTDTFFFQPLKPVKAIQRVEVLMCDQAAGNAARTGGSWTCQAMRVYRVSAVRGAGMCGYVSDRQYADFAGRLIAQMEQPRTFTWSRDAVFRVTADGAGDGKLAQADEPYATAAAERVFRLDIADSYGAGVRAMGNAVGKSIADSRFGECAALDLRYVDIYGSTREVFVPLVTGVLAYALEHGVSETEKLAGVAQEGDTLALSASLPDFQELSSVRLLYGTGAALSAAGISAPASSGTEDRTVRPAASAEGSEDLLSLTGFSVYDPAETDVSVSVPEDEAALRPVFQGMPLSYYRAPSASGSAVRPVAAGGTGTELALTAYEPGAVLLPADKSERYLVALTTDDSALAGTTSDLEMILSYTDLNGRAQTSGVISVSDAANRYYGEWPGVRSGFMYRAGVRSGGTLYFTVSLKDVDRFTGVRFRLTSGENDWQMKGMELYRLDELSARSAVWETVSDGTQTSDRQYYRTFTGSLLKRLNETLLVEDRDLTGLDFESDSTAADEDTGDWSQYRYSMSYDTTQTLDRFAKSRYHYSVAVEVGSDQVTDAADGDCGSKNQFYFQLVFEDGKSAYVLANQQLAADGFRSGYTESFTISTNRDMGELTAVKILPEDTADKSDVFDKLKIDSIRVNRQTNEAVSRQWIVGSVGWIDINYQDEAANSSAVGYSGRSETELVRTYQVDSSTYVVNLEFAVTTGAYDASAADPTRTDSQLLGQVYGSVRYYDSNGVVRTRTYDLVQAMYDYNGKEAKKGDKAVIGQYQWPGGVESDTDTMFRAGKTDRFTLGIEDVSQLLDLTLEVRSKGPTTWNIENVYVSLSGSGGRRIINAQDEYQRINTQGAEQLCSSTNSGQKAYSLFLPLNQVQSTIIGFTENSIAWEGSVRGQISSVTSRLPRSADDSLNLYVYLADTEDSPDVSGITMDSAVQYSRVYGGFNRVEQQLQGVESGGQKLFYATGVSASGIDTLNRLDILAYFNDLSASGQVLLDHAVIQQVRSGVVISSYYVELEGCDAAADRRGISREPSTKLGTSQYRQTVTLAFGDMPSLRLTPETDDVAVALRYTTTNDVTAQEYESPFIYLTDQSWTELQTGRVVELTFQEPYVKEITGIKIRGTGHSTRDSVNVSCAAAAVYESAGGSERCTGQFSFASGVRLTVGSGDQVMACTARDGGTGIGTVGRLDLSFAVPSVTDVPKAAENADGAVAMTLNYRDVNGVLRTRSFYDLREYAVGNGIFTPGSTVTVRMLLPEAQEIRWIDLTPFYETGTEGALLLSSVSASFTRGGKSAAYQRSLADWSGSGTIPLFNSIQVGLSAETVDPATGAQEQISTENGSSSPLVESGQRVVITPAVKGSEGYTVRAEKYRGGFTAGAPETLTYDGDRIVFQAVNEVTAGTGETVSYRIIISSKEVPSLQAVLSVGVEPKLIAPAAAETGGASADSGAASPEDGAQTGGTASADTGASGGGGEAPAA